MREPRPRPPGGRGPHGPVTGQGTDGDPPSFSVFLVSLAVLISVLLPGCLTRYDTRVVQLTDGPHEIVRDEDSVILEQDYLLYSRSGKVQRENSTTGLIEEVWDNGTYVRDIWDDTEARISDTVLEADMDGRTVVWRHGDQIRVHKAFSDGVTTLPLEDARPSGRPSVSDGRIVWVDTRHDDDLQDGQDIFHIYIYDMNTDEEERLTQAPSAKGSPHIHGDTVTWADGRNGTFDIFMMDLKDRTEVQITYDPNDQLSPKVSERAVVWIDTRASTYERRQDIFYHDLETGADVRASSSGKVMDFDVSGPRIVWEDNSLENRPYQSGDIFQHDIRKNETSIYFASDWSQWSPAISGNRVVWVDGAREGGEIRTRERIERPVYGMEETTVSLIVVAAVVASSVIVAYRMRLRREERERVQGRQASRERERGSGPKTTGKQR